MKVGDLMTDEQVNRLNHTVQTLRAWWKAPETQQGIANFVEQVQTFVCSDQFRDGLEVLLGFAALNQELEQQAGERGITVEELRQEAQDAFASGPVNVALGFSIGDLSEVVRATLLHGKAGHDVAVVQFATADETLDSLANLAENHPMVDMSSQSAMSEAIEAAKRGDFVAAHRTLIPEVERFIVNLGVANDVLVRRDGDVYEVSTNKQVRGFWKKATKTASGLEEGEEDLVKLRDHWTDHMNATRHGERDSSWSPELLTADVVFIMFSLLTLTPDFEA